MAVLAIGVAHPRLGSSLTSLEWSAITDGRIGVQGLGEVDLMSRIRHPNLVALLGYASDGREPLVVYELMQNCSLHDPLHGPSCDASALVNLVAASIKCVSSTGDSFKHQVLFYISHL